MPSENGKLSDDERTAASEKVNETAQHAGDPCPHCGDTNTSVAEDLFRLAVSDTPIPTRFIPVIPIVCNNCGFLRLVNSRALGVEPINSRLPAESEG